MSGRKLYITATALKHIHNVWNIAHREDDIQDIHRVSHSECMASEMRRLDSCSLETGLISFPLRRLDFLPMRSYASTFAGGVNAGPMPIQ